MGAVCGKASSDEPQACPQAQQQQQQQQQQQPSEIPLQEKAQPHDASNGVGNGAPVDIAPVGGSGVQPASAGSAAAAAPLDEGEVNVTVGADPEFKDPDAAAQSNGDEALSYWDRNKTFKPERKLPAGSKQSHLQHTMQATMKATLGGGELQNTVKLPEGEDLNEWIAVNTVHFFNAASMIYGTCTLFCTDSTCPTMSAGKAEYLWKDGVNYKKPTRVSAPVYIDLLLSWADERISNPALFPVEQNAKFPRQFLSEVKQIYKRLFRLYAHLYCAHSEKIRSIGANAHLNTCFKHFVYFILEFNKPPYRLELVSKEEMAVLQKLIDKLMGKQQQQQVAAQQAEPLTAPTQEA